MGRERGRERERETERERERITKNNSGSLINYNFSPQQYPMRILSVVLCTQSNSHCIPIHSIALTTVIVIPALHGQTIPLESQHHCVPIPQANRGRSTLLYTIHLLLMAIGYTVHSNYLRILGLQHTMMNHPSIVLFIWYNPAWTTIEQKAKIWAHAHSQAHIRTHTLMHAHVRTHTHTHLCKDIVWHPERLLQVIRNYSTQPHHTLLSLVSGDHPYRCDTILSSDVIISLLKKAIQSCCQAQANQLNLSIHKPSRVTNPDFDP